MIVLREMREEDVAGVMRIEEVVSLFPWNYSIFSDCIKVGYSCWVFSEDEDIVGYGLFSIAANEAHILNLGIKPERQHQGLGRRMLTHLLKEMQAKRAVSAYLEVRVSNQIAFDLYQKMGFTVIGHRKDYYQANGGREDASVLEYVFNA